MDYLIVLMILSLVLIMGTNTVQAKTEIEVKIDQKMEKIETKTATFALG